MLSNKRNKSPPKPPFWFFYLSLQYFAQFWRSYSKLNVVRTHKVRLIPRTWLLHHVIIRKVGSSLTARWRTEAPRRKASNWQTGNGKYLLQHNLFLWIIIVPSHRRVKLRRNLWKRKVSSVMTLRFLLLNWRAELEEISTISVKPLKPHLIF